MIIIIIIIIIMLKNTFRIMDMKDNKNLVVSSTQAAQGGITKITTGFTSLNATSKGLLNAASVGISKVENFAANDESNVRAITGVINNFLLILYVGGEEAIYPGPGERTRIQ